MALALGVLGRLGIDDFLAGEGFAQRTPRTPRFGKGNAEMFICCMGIDHEWTRIFTNVEGRGNGTTKDLALSSIRENVPEVCRTKRDQNNDDDKNDV